MPLKPGYSRATVNANIATMIREGKPERQAVAAALNTARAQYLKKHPGGFPPWHLRTAAEKARTGPAARQNPAKRLSLWKYNTRSGLWDHMRNITEETKADWLSVFMADDPNSVFKIATKQPSGNPAKMRSNPARREHADAAADLSRRFMGREPDSEFVYPKPKIPDAMACIGKIFAIEYIAERDGKEYRFRHVFKAKSRPHLAVTPDGSLATMIGGSWHFGEDGFEDD